MTTPAIECPVTDAEILEFCAHLQSVSDAHYAKNYDRLTPPDFKPDPGGKKYIRICRRGPGEHSAVCFIKREDGSIWKPAGFKGPERNFPRGNIRDKSYRWVTSSASIATR